MSSELERRLEGVFAEAPEPDPGAGEEALHRALRALHPVAAPAARAPRRRPRVRGGGRPARDRGRLARGRRRAARQFRREAEAGAGDDRAPASEGSERHRGHRLRPALGDRRRAASTSRACRSRRPPCLRTALYVAAGIGRLPRRAGPEWPPAWSQPSVRAVPLRPRVRHGRVDRLGAGRLRDRLRRPHARGHRFVLHVICGNGTHDTVVDRGARGRRSVLARQTRSPSRTSGRRQPRRRLRPRARVARHVVALGPSPSDRHLAFAPSGTRLALQCGERVPARRNRPTTSLGAARLEAFGLAGRPAWPSLCPARTQP